MTPAPIPSTTAPPSGAATPPGASDDLDGTLVPPADSFPPAKRAPRPPPLPLSAGKGDCDNGAQDGIESDIDCGGACEPCAIEKQCRLARDCVSGRCGEGICVERPLDSDDPIPDGYEVAMSRGDAASTARAAGVLFLGVGYAGAYLAALSLPSVLGKMYVPVIGPWLSLKHVEGGDGKTWLVADGATQAVGLGLLVGGYALAGRQLLRKPKSRGEGETVQVIPHVGRHASGLTVAGRF